MTLRYFSLALQGAFSIERHRFLITGLSKSCTRGIQIYPSPLTFSLNGPFRSEFHSQQKLSELNYFSRTSNLIIRNNLSDRNHPKMGKKSKAKLPVYIAAKKNEKISDPSMINLVSIGTGGPGTSRCLLLSTGQTRLMFNCGEGTQRLLSMDKKLIRHCTSAKLTNVDNIFVTQKSWESLGGLLGIALSKHHMQNQRHETMNESTSSDLPTLVLYGPEGIERITTVTRQSGDHLSMNIVRKIGEFEDSALKITPLIFHKRVSERNSEISSDRDRSPSPKRSKTDLDCPEKQSLGSNEDSLCGDEVYGYLCNIKPATPKINIEKCVDAGVTIGPMVGELKRGFSVTLDDGTVVHPSQVIYEENLLDISFLVIDCPSETYFQSLDDCSVLRQYRKQNEKIGPKSFCLVVHMTPADVLNTPYYQKWMEGFGADTDHLIMNEDASSVNASRLRNYQAHLNVVNAEVFPMAPVNVDEATADQPFSKSSIPITTNAETQERFSKNVRTASYGLIYTLRGKEFGFHTETDDFDLAALHDKIVEIPEVKAELETLRQIMSSSSTDHNHSKAEFPKVVFLGTGSSQPSVYRSQSCILVHISEESSMILDCGEDSFGQLYHFYGPAKTNQVLSKIKAIFISHLHGDHHMGLVTLLQERKRAFDDLNIPFEPTLLLIPIQLRKCLRFYQHEYGQISHLFRLFHHQNNMKITDDETSFIMTSEDSILKEVGLSEYTPVRVIHCKDAYGLSVTLNSGFKLVYSGDTRPCLELAKIGKDCNLLIHEATHDDTLIHLAIAAKHSTFSEAVKIGEQMNAKHVILTHFSQRYTYMIPFMDTVPSNVGIAFDNMQVSPKTISSLSKFIPALTAIFDEKLQKNFKQINDRIRKS